MINKWFYAWHSLHTPRIKIFIDRDEINRIKRSAVGIIIKIYVQVL